MPINFILKNEDGTTNLDLTSKILRYKYSCRLRYYIGELYDTYVPNVNRNVSFRVKDIWGVGAPEISSEIGTKPAGALTLDSCLTDGVVYLCSPNGAGVGGGSSNVNAYIQRYLITESWSDIPSSFGNMDVRTYSENGNLLWSASTLKDSIIYVGSMEFTSIGQVKTISSSRGRRLFICVDSVFSSGTWDGESQASSSGAYLNWSNNGKTVTGSYFRDYDNDINAALASRGSLKIDVYEIAGVN